MIINEIVKDGSAPGLRAPDPMTIGDFLQPERDYVARVAAEINEVICRTERHEHGITYIVRMELACGEPSCTACPHEYDVWNRFVRFGTTDRDCAGGHFFQVAAQDQEAIGRYVWREMQAARELSGGPDNSYFRIEGGKVRAVGFIAERRRDGIFVEWHGPEHAYPDEKRVEAFVVDHGRSR